jgi:hypothetical protein
MRARALLAIVMLIALVLPAAASAGVAFVFRGSSGASKVTVAGFAVGGGLPLGTSGEPYPGGWYEDPATLIVDVSPHTAQVFLDGRPLGTAGELVAQALPVAIGPHVLQVQAPGFRTRSWQFYADGSFPVRVRAILALD